MKWTLSEEVKQAIIETDCANEHNWSDVSELNYWARRIGFVKWNRQS
jgi:hypothetical protein